MALPGTSTATAMAALLLCGAASAAMAPQYRNLDDLEVMLGFLRAHAHVAATVVGLDVSASVIHFGKGCRVVFGREPPDASKPPMPGASARLAFRSATCPLTAR